MDEVSALLHDAAGEQPLNELWERASGRSADFAVEEERGAPADSAAKLLPLSTRQPCAHFMRSRKRDLATRDFARPAHPPCSDGDSCRIFPVYRIYAGSRTPRRRTSVFCRGRSRRENHMPAERPVAGRILGRGSVASAHPRRRPIAQQAVGRGAIPATDRGAVRQSRRGHRLLSLRPADLAQRRRLRSPPVQLRLRRIPRRMQARAADFPHCDACDRDARSQARRGRSRAARRAERAAQANGRGRVERWIGLCAAHCAAAGDRRRCRARAIPAILLKRSSAPGRSAWSRQTAAGWRPTPSASPHGSRRHCVRPSCSAMVGAERELRSAPAANFIVCAFGRTIRTAGRDCRLRAAHRAGGRRQRPGSSSAQADRARRARHLPRHGILGFQPGRSRQSVAGRFRNAETFAQGNFADYICGRTCSRLGRRWHQASDDRPRSRTAKEEPRLFADGSYVPLEAVGPFAGHVFAFARILGNSAAVVAICRCCTNFLSDDGSLTIPPARWKDTRIMLPRELQGIKLGSVLSGEEIAADDRAFAAAQILCSLPVALLTDQSR